MKNDFTWKGGASAEMNESYDPLPEGSGGEQLPVSISALTLEPWPEKTRVRVLVQLTSATPPPNLLAELRDGGGEVVRAASLVEVTFARMVFTMHLPHLLDNPPYSVQVHLLRGEEVLETRCAEIDLS